MVSNNQSNAVGKKPLSVMFEHGIDLCGRNPPSVVSKLGRD